MVSFLFCFSKWNIQFVYLEYIEYVYFEIRNYLATILKIQNIDFCIHALK